ncbi:hypothetical protein POTOM_017697 [Populus tomentosa]|uniref:UspA domain-containing protein n=1 Tax=Populus tomentosa TaxID=118781 RepID=A0A8X8A4S3_POPTO|nr:hypothetical protein POTOM_017697 [Populus tomentosa]
MNSKIFAMREKHTLKALETLEEDEEYNWKEVTLPSFIPVVPKPELDRETGERRRGRDIVVAIDHGPNSKHAFDWALIHLCRLADTIHLVHAILDMKNVLVYDTTEGLLEKLAVEALQVAMQNLYRLCTTSVLQGSVGEYCLHNCKVPVIIVPGKAESAPLM